MGLIARIKTWVAGEVLNHTDLNAEFDNLIDNLDPDAVIGASASQGAMDGVTDPYPGGVPSLSTNLRGELQRLRYRLWQEQRTTKWFIFPDIKNIVNSDSPFSATSDHRVIKCDASSGAITVVLPLVGGLVDKVMMIKKTDSSANTVTIDGNGAELIDGATTKVLNLQYDSVILVADGTGWHILADINKGIVTLTDTQTLTNKTLTTPTIGDFTNANHDHSGAGGGGALGTNAVPTVAIQDGAITTAKLATSAVTIAKMSMAQGGWSATISVNQSYIVTIARYAHNVRTRVVYGFGTGTAWVIAKTRGEYSGGGDSGQMDTMTMAANSVDDGYGSPQYHGTGYVYWDYHA